MDELVKAFFEAYEKANSTSDFAAVGDLYAETFLFAGQEAAKSVSKIDFLKVIPRMKDHFASLGLTGSRVSSVKTTHLDSRYVLAKVGWAMTLRTANGGAKNLDTSATYVLRRADHEKLSIVFQLDHQDLAAMVNQARDAEPC